MPDKPVQNPPVPTEKGEVQEAPSEFLVRYSQGQLSDEQHFLDKYRDMAEIHNQGLISEYRHRHFKQYLLFATGLVFASTGPFVPVTASQVTLTSVGTILLVACAYKWLGTEPVERAVEFARKLLTQWKTPRNDQ